MCYRNKFETETENMGSRLWIEIWSDLTDEGLVMFVISTSFDIQTVSSEAMKFWKAYFHL